MTTTGAARTAIVAGGGGSAVGAGLGVLVGGALIAVGAGVLVGIGISVGSGADVMVGGSVGPGVHVGSGVFVGTMVSVGLGVDVGGLGVRVGELVAVGLGVYVGSTPARRMLLSIAVPTIDTPQHNSSDVRMTGTAMRRPPMGRVIRQPIKMRLSNLTADSSLDYVVVKLGYVLLTRTCERSIIFACQNAALPAIYGSSPPCHPTSAVWSPRHSIASSLT